MANTDNRQTDLDRAERAAASGGQRKDEPAKDTRHPQKEAQKEAHKESRKDAQSHAKEARSGHTSSHGDSPVDIVPKEVSPDDAAWRDRTERKLRSEDQEERQEALTDEAIDLTFPASDPPAIPTPRDDAKARSRQGTPSR